MLAVIDANIIFSAMLAEGKLLQIFLLNNVFNKYEFIAPEYIFLELGRRLDKLLRYSKLSKDELARVFEFLKQEIEFIPLNTFKHKVDDASGLVVHMKDIPYMALALSFGCPIISGDKGMRRQSEVPILGPNEDLESLFGST